MSIVDEHAVWQEQISAYLDGELNAEEERELMDHLDECEKCRSAMLLLQGMGAGLRADTAEPPLMLAEGARFLYEKERAQKKFSLRPWRFTAIAAVICVALLGVATLVPRGSNAMKSSAATADSAGGEYVYHSFVAEDEAASEYGDVTEVAVGMNSAPLTKYEGVAPAETAAAAAAPAATPAPAPESARAAAATPAPAATPASTPMASSAPTSAPSAAAAGGNAGGMADAGKNAPGEDAAEEPEYSTRTGGMYTTAGLPGYAIYCELEDPSRYYSVCFVYGEVPQTIREDVSSILLEAPEGQERWLVSLEVCLNEGLLEQFQEIYYGDLLSQQGLVIGILDMEEEKWAP